MVSQVTLDIQYDWHVMAFIQVNKLKINVEPFTNAIWMLEKHILQLQSVFFLHYLFN